MLTMILVILLVLFLFGGVGTYYGRGAGWGPGHYSGGGIGLILIILLIIFLFGGFGGGYYR